MYVKVRQRLGVLSERQMGSTVGKIELTWTCVRRESGCLRWSCQARGEEKDQRCMDVMKEDMKMVGVKVEETQGLV